MTAVLEQTWSMAEVADMLDVGQWYVQHWGAKWHRFTVTDVMLLRAVVAITGAERGGSALVSRSLRRSHIAIQNDPRRWLALTASGACTFDQPAEAMPWWEARSRAGDHCLRLIDLQPEAVPA